MRCIAIRPLFAQPMRMVLAKQIGENIKQARKAKGWSLERLAARVEPASSYQQISRLEKGDRALTVQWVERIATALEIDPLSLMAPERDRPQRFTLDEQVANEVALTLAEVALQGERPDNGIVQEIALILRELTATFAAHPQAAADAQVARPLLDVLGRRYVPEAR